jgi:hypothetical protein
VEILVEITNEGVLCRLEALRTVTIAAGDGQPIALEGKGLTLTANGAIDTANVGIGFRWTN